MVVTRCPLAVQRSGDGPRSPDSEGAAGCGATHSRAAGCHPGWPPLWGLAKNVLQHISSVRIRRGVMVTALRQRLIQDRFEGPVHEAVLNLLVASASLQERSERLFG